MQASFHQSESIHISPKYEAEHRKDNAVCFLIFQIIIF